MGKACISRLYLYVYKKNSELRSQNGLNLSYPLTELNSVRVDASVGGKHNLRTPTGKQTTLVASRRERLNIG
ncbi:MAG: hypothetical protein V7K69_18080 [Nostoc sp.]